VAVLPDGRNGVGRSALLQTIVGLQAARAGSITLGGGGHHWALRGTREGGSPTFPGAAKPSLPHRVRERPRRGGACKTSGLDIVEQALERRPRLRKILDRPPAFSAAARRSSSRSPRARDASAAAAARPADRGHPAVDHPRDRGRDRRSEEREASILLVAQYVDVALRLAGTDAVMDVGRIVAAGPTETFERERMRQLMSV
jgi:urea transport system ATP-binding protein